MTVQVMGFVTCMIGVIVLQVNNSLVYSLLTYLLTYIHIGIDHQVAYTGADCSLYTCPKGYAWVSDKVAKANDIHPMAECSNKGICDRGSGTHSLSYTTHLLIYLLTY